MSETEFENIKRIFTENQVEFTALEHAEATTSAEAAAARNSKLSQGVKAMVVKCTRKGKEFFIVIDIPANRILDWKKVKKALQANDCRLADQGQVKEKTNCEVGGVPPFGHSLPILADSRIFNEKTLEFNAGLKTKSIRVQSAGLKKVFEKLGVAYFDFVKE